MKNTLRSSAALVLFATALPVFAEDAEYAKIRAGVSKLAPLLGSWNTVWSFFDKDGVTEEVGTTEVSYVLDETYLQLVVERHNPRNPARRKRMITYITYNPRSSQYDTTYFYSRWAVRVTETGEYDDEDQEFHTSALIPLEDGKRDENVRTITSFRDPNRLVHTHYSRYNNEDSERRDLEIVMRRAK
jgi:hypothetical protein